MPATVDIDGQTLPSGGPDHPGIFLSGLTIYFNPITLEMSMSASEQEPKSDFSVDTNHLYREETITDLKIASIKVLTPINLDGSEDKSRTHIYVGHTQLMSPEGPLPLQASLEAHNLEEAMAVFPDAMRQALAEMVEKIKKIQQQQKIKEMDSSRIIIPGR